MQGKIKNKHLSLWFLCGFILIFDIFVYLLFMTLVLLKYLHVLIRCKARGDIAVLCFLIKNSFFVGA
ncbi:hypothetical protein A9G39_04400 [Gilliamella sp. Imp1-6]|nr:hypothetical protein A9G39_04400 [Gilliamella apicola]